MLIVCCYQNLPYAKATTHVCSEWWHCTNISTHKNIHVYSYLMSLYLLAKYTAHVEEGTASDAIFIAKDMNHEFNSLLVLSTITWNHENILAQNSCTVVYDSPCPCFHTVSWQTNYSWYI